MRAACAAHFDAGCAQGNAEGALATGRKLLLAPGVHAKTPLLEFHARTLVATGAVPRAVTLYEQLYREDPDNTGVAKALKRVRAMQGGKDAGNAAFKAGSFQLAYDQCAAGWAETSAVRVSTICAEQSASAGTRARWRWTRSCARPSRRRCTPTAATAA